MSTPDFSEEAKPLAKKFYSVVPLEPGQKFPAKRYSKNWPTRNYNKLALHGRWPQGCGVGIKLGSDPGRARHPSFFALDLDIYDKEIVEALTRQLEFLVSGAPLVGRVGQPPKILFPCIGKGIDRKLFSPKFLDDHGTINQIEILAKGQFFVAYGIHPGTGKPYSWDSDLPAIRELPRINKDLILDPFFSYFDKLCRKKGWTDLGAVEDKARIESMTRQSRARKALNISNFKPGPAAIYNESVTLESVLETYGWVRCQANYWRRPGKRQGISATQHGQILWPFTSSTCLEPNRAADTFEIMAAYEFHGNKSEAARALLRAIK